MIKKTFLSAVVALGFAGSAAFAQGMEGQQIGYNDKADAGVSYSSRNDAVDNVKLDIFNSGTFRAE